ncbi:FtsX-like permease family protein [Oceanicoccus sp. KOV_DT_Chl]|uniref:FtsX-like permease family protein n=1 Tax=Oceanicoccus sp. KOV_DT_Chl TaxID=1904639 RepID=UPI000C7D075C|nr:FtsX-like permease family protein [Oceanicoccus sp. KOV_DT_Chl]
MSTLLFDLRYTLRLLMRSPAFTALCITVIALAISLALTIYVVVGNQGIKPLPIPHGDRYVALMLQDKETYRILRGDRINAFIYQTFQQRLQSYQLLGAANIHRTITTSDDGIAEAEAGASITPNLLQATQAIPLLGRNLVASDAEIGAAPVALIGYEQWQNYYAGRKDIIGHLSRIDGQARTIVGVMPQNFGFPTDHHIWTPLQLPSNADPSNNSFRLTIIGILKKGTSVEQADSELKALIAQLANEYPDEYGHLSARTQPYIYAASANDWGTMNIVMLTAAGIILLLACLNVGNLLLVRANERTQELVIRSALGGSRQRIIQQVLMESFIICFVGGVIGLWLGSFGADYVRYQTEIVVGSSFLPFWMSFDIGPDIFLLTIAATLLVWLLAGGIPAWRASQLDINSALSGGGKGVTGKGNSKVAKGLVAVEVVCSFFLLVLSGAFVSSVHFANQIDYGVDTNNYISGFVNIREDAYPEDTDRVQFFTDLRTTLVQNPAIEAASFTNALPGMGYWRSPYNVEDRDLQSNNHYPNLIMIPIDQEYF